MGTTADHKITKQPLSPANFSPCVNSTAFSSAIRSRTAAAAAAVSNSLPGTPSTSSPSMLKLEGRSCDGGWEPQACESCRSAPCAVYCRADAAALCAACDASIHSANLLARRHYRVPILPGHGSAGLVVRPSLNFPYHVGFPAAECDRDEDVEEADEQEAASWLLLDPAKGGGEEVDEFLDLVEYNSNSSENQGSECRHGRSEESEGAVPNDRRPQSLRMEHEASNGFSFAASLGHSVSLSSMDASVVPDAAADVSNSHVRACKGTIDLFSGQPLKIPPLMCPMDREARVLRYREKRKMRRFEKTIRYASRKAYAETRPRIKGRFAKKSNVDDAAVDEMFSSASFGVVPSF